MCLEKMLTVICFHGIITLKVMVNNSKKLLGYFPTSLNLEEDLMSAAK